MQHVGVARPLPVAQRDRQFIANRSGLLEFEHGDSSPPREGLRKDRGATRLIAVVGVRQAAREEVAHADDPLYPVRVAVEHVLGLSEDRIGRWIDAGGVRRFAGSRLLQSAFDIPAQ